MQYALAIVGNIIRYGFVCVLVFIILAEDILISLKYKYRVAFMQVFISNPPRHLPSPRPH